jgi:tripartite-type tricarboxylate transporter receptor subunit TctC
MVHVPYKGLAPALTDLLSGQVQIMFSSVVAILPHIKAGKLKAIGVSGSKRLSLLPELPTIAEQGVAGYETSSWYGILVPAGTPKEIVAKLNVEINKILKDPDVRRVLATDGADPVGGTPEEFSAYIASETNRLGKVVKDAHIQIE